MKKPVDLCRRFYGEAEFIFGAIKLTTIVGLILLMLIITCGGAPNGDAIGFRYWRHPGAMNEYLVDGSLGKFLAFWKASETLLMLMCAVI